MADVTLAYVDLIGDADRSLPLGPLYIAGFLQSRGTSCEIRDYSLWASFTDKEALESPESLCAFLEGSAPIVGISCMSNTVPFVLASVDAVKRRAPERTIVLGGYGTFACAKLVLERFPAVDFVMTGPGEAPMLALVERLRDGGSLSAVPGLVYRDGDRVVENPPLALDTAALDALPMAAYELIDLNDYPRPPSVVTARGCPFDCAFCEVVAFNGRRVVKRGLGPVFDEIEHLTRLLEASGRDDPRKVAVADDTFFVTAKRAHAFCDEIEKRGIDLTWAVNGRIDQADEDLFRRMGELGCRGIFFGVESGSDTVLASISKGSVSDMARPAVELGLTHIGGVDVSFIWGLPSETTSDFHDTVMLASFLSTLGASVHAYQWAPLPGSRLYAEHRDSLVFDPRFVSDIVPTRVTPDGQLAAFIRDNPIVSAAFHHYPHPDLAARRDMLRKVGLKT